MKNYLVTLKDGSKYTKKADHALVKDGGAVVFYVNRSRINGVYEHEAIHMIGRDVWDNIELQGGVR